MIFHVLSIPYMEGVLVDDCVRGCIGLLYGCSSTVGCDVPCSWCNAVQVLCCMCALSFSLSVPSSFLSKPLLLQYTILHPNLHGFHSNQCIPLVPPPLFVIPDPAIPISCPFQDAYYFDYSDMASGFCGQAISTPSPASASPSSSSTSSTASTRPVSTKKVGSSLAIGIHFFKQTEINLLVMMNLKC